MQQQTQLQQQNQTAHLTASIEHISQQTAPTLYKKSYPKSKREAQQPSNHLGSESEDENRSTQKPAALAEIPECLQNFNDGKISDDEDNSWADGLSESEQAPEEIVPGLNYEEEDDDDDYYGEQQQDYGLDDEYGDQWVIKRKRASKKAGKNHNIDKFFSDRKNQNKVVMNVYCTEYEVVKKAARKVNRFKIIEIIENPDGGVQKRGGKLSSVWDISWHDLAITPDYLAKMEPYQKVSQFPGIYVVCKKNHLGRNLMKMLRYFPEEYDFFPQTWMLPTDLADLRNQFAPKQVNGKRSSKKISKKTFIVKPEGLSQGRGIFLTRNLDRMIKHSEIESCVVQRYIYKPYLIDNLKFDLRIYAFLYGVNPLRVYWHEKGLARFSTEEYQPPSNSNMDNLYMHLTNYAINKNSDKFQQNEDEEDDDQGHKRSFDAILRYLATMGHDTEKLKDEIREIIVKTLIVGQPFLSHLYRSCQPDDLDSSMCFQVLGFDILIDSNCKPWLLEVNQSPSFSTDSPLDYLIKKHVLGDAFRLLNVSYDKKMEYIKQIKEEAERRIYNGRYTKVMTGMTVHERRQLREKKLKERYAFENGRSGGYELIFPVPGHSPEAQQKNKMYERYLQKANDLWDEFTTGRKAKNNAAMNTMMREVKEPLGQQEQLHKRGNQNHQKYEHLSNIKNNTIININGGQQNPLLNSYQQDLLQTPQALLQKNMNMQPPKDQRFSHIQMPPPQLSFNSQSNSLIYPNTDKPKKSIETKKKSSSGLSMIEGSHLQQFRQNSNQLADQFKMLKDGKMPSIIMPGGAYEAVLTTKKTSQMSLNSNGKDQKTSPRSKSTIHNHSQPQAVQPQNLSKIENQDQEKQHWRGSQNFQKQTGQSPHLIIGDDRQSATEAFINNLNDVLKKQKLETINLTQSKQPAALSLIKEIEDSSNYIQTTSKLINSQGDSLVKAKINYIQSIIQKRMDDTSENLAHLNISIAQKANKITKANNKNLLNITASSPMSTIKTITGISTTSNNNQKNSFSITNSFSKDNNSFTSHHGIKASIELGSKQGFEKIEEEELFDRDLPRRMRMQQKTTVAQLDQRYIPISLNVKTNSLGVIIDKSGKVPQDISSSKFDYSQDNKKDELQSQRKKIARTVVKTVQGQVLNGIKFKDHENPQENGDDGPIFNQNKFPPDMHIGPNTQIINSSKLFKDRRSAHYSLDNQADDKNLDEFTPLPKIIHKTANLTTNRRSDTNNLVSTAQNLNSPKNLTNAAEAAQFHMSSLAVGKGIISGTSSLLGKQSFFKFDQKDGNSSNTSHLKVSQLNHQQVAAYITQANFMQANQSKEGKGPHQLTLKVKNPPHHIRPMGHKSERLAISEPKIESPNKTPFFIGKHEIYYAQSSMTGIQMPFIEEPQLKQYGGMSKPYLTPAKAKQQNQFYQILSTPQRKIQLDASALVPNSYTSQEFAQDLNNTGLTFVIKHSDLKSHISNLKNSLAGSSPTSFRDLPSPSNKLSSPMKALPHSFTVQQCEEEGELKEVFRKVADKLE